MSTSILEVTMSKSILDDIEQVIQDNAVDKYHTTKGTLKSTMDAMADRLINTFVKHDTNRYSSARAEYRNPIKYYKCIDISYEARLGRPIGSWHAKGYDLNYNNWTMHLLNPKGTRISVPFAHLHAMSFITDKSEEGLVALMFYGIESNN